MTGKEKKYIYKHGNLVHIFLKVNTCIVYRLEGQGIGPS